MSILMSMPMTMPVNTAMQRRHGQRYWHGHGRSPGHGHSYHIQDHFSKIQMLDMGYW
jgi:hypothetical protein